MPRKPATPAAEVLDAVVSPAAAAAASGAVNALAAADDAVIRASGLMQAVGRIQAAHFLETVSSRVMAETYQQILAHPNEINGLPYRDASGETKRVSSIDEFCQVFLGRSQRRLQQLAEQLHLLGPDLYEQAEAIGFRNRDYQALKALPAKQQEAIKEAIADKDGKRAKELLQELAEQHGREREAHAKTKKDVEAKDKLIKQKNEKIDELSTALAWQPSDESVANSQAEEAHLVALADATRALELAFNGLAVVVADIRDTTTNQIIAGRAFQAIQYSVKAMHALYETYQWDLGVSFDELDSQRHAADGDQMPDWMKPEFAPTAKD